MKFLLSFLMLFCAATFAFAQGGAPKKFNYQAVPRKADGTLLAAGSVVKVQFTITEDGPVNIKYGEEHVTTVSQHGVVNAIVGGGASSGILPFNFDAVDWKSHTYFLAVAVDLNGNNVFDNDEKFASSQLLSVPYALYAEKSGSGGTTGPTYQAGAGINIDPVTNTILNLGDTNAADDLTNSSAAGGDLSGTFGNLQIKTDAITGLEIQNGSIGTADLNQMGAANGQILKWNGTAWAASNDETSGGGGTGLTQVAVGTPLAGNGTPGSPILISPNAIGGNLIQDGGIGSADLNQMGATNGQILSWNGSAWAPITNPGGGGGTGLTQVAVTTPLAGNGTAGSPIAINQNGISGNLIQNGGIEAVDLGQMGAANGQILKWNGSNWAVSNDETGAPNTGLTQVAVGTPLAGNGTAGSPIVISPSGIGGNLIQDGGIGSADLNQMGAANGQILKWNGTAWVASNDETGAPNTGLTQVAVTAPLAGNGTAGSPIGISANAIGSSLIQDGTVTATDLAPGTIPTSLPPSGTASGDLSGNYPAPKVDAIQGFPVNPTIPTTNQVLKWNGTAWAPAPDETSTGGTGADNWGTQTAVTAMPISGNGTSGNPISLPPNSLTGSFIQDGTIQYADLAPGVILTPMAGAGISIAPNTANSYLIHNTLPDVPVALNGTGGTTVSGAYPNFTIHSPIGGGGGGSVSGTTNYLSKFTNATTVGNSSIYETLSGNIGINTTTPDGNLDINGGELVLHKNTEAFNMTLRADGMMAFEANGTTGNNTLVIDDDNDRSVNIGSATPVAGFKLHVVGKAKFDTGVFLGNNESFTDGGVNEIATNADLRPTVNSNGIIGFDLGTTSRYWRALYGQKGYFATEVGVGTTNVGTGFKLQVAGKAKFDDGVFLGSVENFFDGGTSQIGTNATLRPHINATTTTGRDLGATNYRWQHIYGLYGNLGEGLKVGAGITNFAATAVHFIGNESDGTTNATLKIESGTQNMLFDGNEIDCINSSMHLQNNSNGNLLLANGGGEVGIGTTAPTARLSVNGTANKPGGGNWSTFSDRRLKQNVANFSMGMEVLNQIKPVTFHYNGQLGMSPDPEYVGIIAQDLQKIAPFMVSTTEIREGAEAGQSFLNVDPSAFTYILINSVQTQQAEINDLRAQLAAQQAQITVLLAGFEQLKASILLPKSAETGQK